MKKVLLLLLLIATILLIPMANADLTVLSRYKGLFSADALEAAAQAKMPEDLLGLTNLEKELFELGFAAGYDAALAPKPQTYIVNKSSQKFHKPECSGVDKIADKNKMEITCTRDELLQWGYEPCGSCNP